MAGSVYQFMKGLGKKPSKAAIKSEYIRKRNNLLKSIRGYKNKGIDTSFFNVPAIPKKITEGSIRNLEKAINEWHYYTGRGSVDLSKLPKVSKTGKDSYKNIASISGRDIHVKRAQERTIQEQIDKENRLKQLNADNPYYQQAVAQGFDISQLPRDDDNLALKLYEIAEEALDSPSAVNGRQEAFFSVVEKKAQLSIMRFNDMGVLDPNYNIVYSFNLSQQDFVAIAMEFEAWLWASDQYLNPDLSGLEKVVNYMTKSQKNLSFFMKSQLANAVADEDIDMI